MMTRDAYGRIVPRFTDEAADRREEARRVRKANRKNLARSWAEGATDAELRESLSPDSEIARVEAAITELQRRRTH